MTNREFIEQNKSTKDKIKVLGTMGIGTTPEGSKELNYWDRRRWLVLKDFWLGHISQEHSDWMLAKITEEEGRENERTRSGS